MEAELAALRAAASAASGGSAPGAASIDPRAVCVRNVHFDASDTELGAVFARQDKEWGRLEADGVQA